MKRFFAIILSAMLLVSFAGCNNESSNDTSSKVETASESSKTETTSESSEIEEQFVKYYFENKTFKGMKIMNGDDYYALRIVSMTHDIPDGEFDIPSDYELIKAEEYSYDMGGAESTASADTSAEASTESLTSSESSEASTDSSKASKETSKSDKISNVSMAANAGELLKTALHDFFVELDKDSYRLEIYMSTTTSNSSKTVIITRDGESISAATGENKDNLNKTIVTDNKGYVIDNDTKTVTWSEFEEDYAESYTEYLAQLFYITNIEMLSSGKEKFGDTEMDYEEYKIVVQETSDSSSDSSSTSSAA